MFDQLTADERNALMHTLYNGANKASKVTLSLGDICLKTLDYDSPQMGHVWTVRARFQAMGSDLFTLANSLAT